MTDSTIKIEIPDNNMQIVRYALAAKHACPVDTIQILSPVNAGGFFKVQINEVIQELNYAETLEEAIQWLARNGMTSIDGYRPVAHLHREDIIHRQGIYIGHRLSEDDIDIIAEKCWTDSFADAFWDAQDYIVEEYFSAYVNAPQAILEKILEDELYNIGLYGVGLADIEHDIFVAFLNQTVAEVDELDKQERRTLTRRFIDYLVSHEALPDEVDVSDITYRLDAEDYHDQFFAYIYDIVEAGHVEGDKLVEVKVYAAAIRSSLLDMFESGTSVQRAFEELLPQIITIVDSYQQKQAAFEQQMRINQRHALKQSLLDPVHETMLDVEITTDKDGITLRFPQLDKAHPQVEHIVTIDFRSHELQVLIHNGEYQNTAQRIAIGMMKDAET